MSVLALPARAQQTDPLEFSLEELLDVPVVASLTRLSPAELPASVTVITAEDIALSPARNVYDLLETYVPGAIWMNREGGPVPGIRGNIIDRNYKVLLIVDGRLMNSRGFFGAKSELEQWDLTDIERIQVVRGPGSVTHGPGAVAGVISIRTFDAQTASPARISARYTGRYRSTNTSAHYSVRRDDFRLYTYGSVTRTPGWQAPHYIVDDVGEFGFVGVDVEQDSEPLEYFADYQDDPQLKFHVDARFGRRWRFWGRYTQQGSTWRGNEAKTLFGGELVNQEGTRDRQWSLNAEQASRPSPNVSWTSLVGIGSYEGERRQSPNRIDDPDHPLNFGVDYAETEAFLRNRINWTPTDGSELALGIEYARTRHGAGWGDEVVDFRMGDGGIIVNGPDSRAILTGNRGSADRRGTEIFVGDGFSVNTGSVFAEANLHASPEFRVLLSGRADKSTGVDWLMSPRIALSYRLADNQFVKLIGQRSHRTDTHHQVLIDKENGVPTETESLTGVELAFSRRVDDGLNVDAAAFFNDLDIIANDGARDASGFVGDLRLAGFELVIDGRAEFGRFGASYSYVKQIDWTLAEGVGRSGISYSDYNQPVDDVDGAVQTGVGNDLNNWPTHALKAFGRTRLTERATLHVDTRFSWNWQGALDGIEGLRRAVEGFPEAPAIEETIDQILEMDPYGSDFRLNAALSIDLATGLTASAFAQNLLGRSGNKRYAYDVGNDDPAPRRLRYTSEPRVLGIDLTYVWR